MVVDARRVDVPRRFIKGSTCANAGFSDGDLGISPRWERSHSRTVRSALAVARVRPSGANATASTASVWPVSGWPSGVAGPDRSYSHSSTVWSTLAVARVRPSGANATAVHRRCGRSAVAEPARPGRVASGPTGAPFRRRWRWPGCARPGRTPPKHRVRCGRSAGRRAGAAGPGRSDPTAAPSRRRWRWPGCARPGRTPPRTPRPVWPVSGLAEPAGPGRVGQIPQQHRLVVRWRWPGCARPGRTPPRTPRRCGRSAARRAGAAGPGR